MKDAIGIGLCEFCRSTHTHTHILFTELLNDNKLAFRWRQNYPKNKMMMITDNKRKRKKKTNSQFLNFVFSFLVAWKNFIFFIQNQDFFFPEIRQPRKKNCQNAFSRIQIIRKQTKQTKKQNTFIEMNRENKKNWWCFQKNNYRIIFDTEQKYFL